MPHDSVIVGIRKQRIVLMFTYRTASWLVITSHTPSQATIRKDSLLEEEDALEAEDDDGEGSTIVGLREGLPGPDLPLLRPLMLLLRLLLTTLLLTPLASGGSSRILISGLELMYGGV